MTPDPDRDVARIAAILAGEPDAHRHLDEDTELFPYVDGTLDAVQREIVESHLDDCAHCRSLAGELRRLRPQRKPPWMALAAAVLIAAALGAVLTRDDVKPPVTPPAITRTAPPETPRYARTEWAALVEETLQRGRLEVARDPALAGTPTVLRGGEAASGGAVEPYGVVIDDVRPLFRWQATPGARSVVSIFDSGRLVEESRPLTRDQWTPARDLPRDRVYTWQVAVTKGEERTILPAPPAPPARFRVISAGEHAALADALRLHPGDHLLLAALYARSGMEREANARLRELAATKPDDPRARRVLENSR